MFGVLRRFLFDAWVTMVRPNIIGMAGRGGGVTGQAWSAMLCTGTPSSSGSWSFIATFLTRTILSQLCTKYWEAKVDNKKRRILRKH